MLVENPETQAVETDTEPIPRAESPPEYPEPKPEHSDLIRRLVRDRQTADTAATRDQLEAFDNIRTHHRDLEPLYLTNRTSLR